MKYDTQTAFMQSLRLNVKWKRWEFHDNKELVPFLKTPQTKYVYQFYVYTYKYINSWEWICKDTHQIVNYSCSWCEGSSG